MFAETSFKKFLVNEDLIKLFEDSTGSGREFSISFTSRESSLYDFPKRIKTKGTTLSDEELAELDSLGLGTSSEIEDHSIEKCELTYVLRPVWTKQGIDIIEFELKSVRLVGDYSIWNEEKDDSDIFPFEIFEPGPISEERIKVSYAREPFPFYPSSIDISMSQSFDPGKWQYDVTIGSWDY